MCGIAGIWGNSDELKIRTMTDFLRHRGPDAEGFYVSPFGPGVLGHVRLSIIDPAGGNQPIHNEDLTAAIIANGEVYNFRKLRQGLETSHIFQTQSDTEVILHLYEEHGSEMVRQLDGMFAFAITKLGDLFLARDPIGIKPLYYGTREEDSYIYFASELKAFYKSDFNVREFPPGTCFHSRKGFIPYYEIPNLPAYPMELDHCIKILRQTLEEAVTKRLMSDVPLGAFLSGGIDSSIIAAIAKQQMKELHTFSVGIEGSKDIEAARMVSRHIDSIHHEYVFTAEEVLQSIPVIIYYLESFDQDLVRSAIPCFFCSKLASDHVKVILTGEGADELFAGYTYYKDIHDPQHLHNELHRSVSALHNINLQRVDRMTMAHGIEGRVPFLDISMIETALRFPMEFKIHNAGSGSRVEKWVLRLAFEELLPGDIIRREKSQFDEGTGTVDLLKNVLGEVMSEDESMEYRRNFPDANLRSSEECFYHRIFMEVFKNPEPVLKNIARWAERSIN